MSREILSKYSDEAFAKIVAENTSILQIGIALGYSSTLGAGFNKIKKRIEDLGLSTEHFTSQPRTKWTKDTAFVKGTLISSRRLRSLYNQYSSKPYICSICGQKPEWNGQPLTLILDHINGDHFDNRIDNLRWVCPNCNQQLDTTGSKNRTKREKIQNHCIDCGKVISKNSTRCHQCAGKLNTSQIYDKLSREQLKELIRKKSFEHIAKQFGYTSGNAVKRWCKYYNLPYLKKDIKQYSDEEWMQI